MKSSGDNYLDSRRDQDLGLSGEGNDIQEGGADTDILLSYAGDDQLYAGLRADLSGLFNTGAAPTAERDWLAGGSGNDLLAGSHGANALFGGGGLDVLIGGAGDDNLMGDSNKLTEDFGWTVVETPGTYIRTFFDSTNTEIPESSSGAGGADTLYGGDGNDWIIGEGGDDVLAGDAGNDYLDGDAYNLDPAQHGRDTLSGGAGQDTLVGNGGDDVLLGGEGDDSLTGDAGDLATPYHGNDYLDGEAGADTLFGLGGDDVLLGGEGQDRDILYGGTGQDSLDGDGGNDDLYGEEGDDYLSGGEGDDWLDGGAGADVLDGGAGADAMLIDGNDKVIVDGQDQVQLINGTTPGDLSQGFSLEYAAGNIAQASISQVTGSDGRQWLSVTFDANNVLLLQNGFLDNGQRFDFGGDSLTQQQLMTYAPAVNLAGTDGTNTIYGSNNGDTLNGGLGNDTLNGQGGDDTYVVDSATDVVIENANGGTDTVQSSVTYTLVNNVENLTLTGTNVIDGTGNDLDNILTGNAATNTLTGGTGNDTLDGGAGIDTLIGGLGDDIYIFGSGEIITEDPDEGIDTVQSPITVSLGALSANLENLTLTGTTTINGTGNALGNVLIGNIATNTLTGNAGNDILDGGAGNDSLIGGLGDDNYIIDNSGDVVTENQDEGNDTIQSSITRTSLENNVENLVLTGTTNINATGNALDNVLTGNIGNNTLTGGGGNDSLYGNAGVDILDGSVGNDLLDGGTGNDTYRFGLGGGQDVIDDNDATAGNLDTIQMGAGVLPTDVTIERSGDDLVLKINGTTDQLTVRNFSNTGGASPTAYRIERITFTSSSEIWDTSQFLLGTPNPEILIATTGDDKIFGYAGNDNLEGLAGNDLLDGGAGSDIMIGGDGWDTYVVDGTGDAVIENYNGGTDTIQSFIDYTLGPNVEKLILLGSTAVWATGNETNNSLTGNDADNILTGGKGNDSLTGGGGSDTYVYNIGDGEDNIDSTRDSSPTSNDAIQFGPGIRPEDVTVSRYSASDNDLVLTMRDPITGVSIQAFRVYDGFNATYGQEILDEVRFTDDTTVWQRTDLYARYLSGGDNNETINGFENRDDVILGNAGDDSLNGSSGNDDLSGGAGNDYLFGSLGGDTYRFGLGYDHDVVVENDTANRIVLDPGISPADVILYRTSSVDQVLKWLGRPLETADDLVISLNGGADQMWVKNYFASPTSRPISQIVFNDGAGTIWDAATIDAQLINLAGTANTVTGTTSDNQYTVDHRNDIVSEPVNGGIDTVLSSVTYTLPNNVENLTLTGPLDIGANANGPLANTIYGNNAANILNGVSVGDTFIGGGGDDFYIAYGGPGSYYNFDGTIIEASNEGYDTVLTRSYAAIMPSNVERMIIWPPSSGLYVPPPVGQFYLGNELDNVIDATLASNYGYGFTIDGGLGADLMIGSARFIVDNPLDVVVGSGTIETTVDYVLPIGVNSLVLAGSAPIAGTGNIGSNTLDGSLNISANALAGGLGDDTYIIDASDTVIENEGEGIDTIKSSSTYTLIANVENLTLTGSSPINGIGNALNNILDGSQNTAANVLTGGSGDDTYVLGAGDSIVEYANEGADTVKSSSTYILGVTLENLTLTGTGAIDGTGNEFANTLTGNSAANVLTGRAGDDTYVIGVGDTVVENTNEGTDIVQSYVTHTLSANVENLTIIGAGVIDGTGNDLSNVLTGNSDNNTLSGLAGYDTLTGNAGDDTLDGGDGADILYGGTGSDTYIIDAADIISENLNEGIDTVNSSITYALGSNLENLILTGTDTISGIGNSLNNYLTGNSAANLLDGGIGADAMSGGLGDDTYVVDVVTDIITENPNEGTDTVQASITYTLGSNVENLTLIGVGNINGTGNTLNNTLTGNGGNNALTGAEGNDTLDGGTGTDTLIGGQGNDAYIVDDVGDTVTKNVNEGTDTVRSSVTYILGVNLENLTLTGTAMIDGIGNELGNVIRGNSASNILTGGDGNDTLGGAWLSVDYYGAANTYYGGTGNDILNSTIYGDTYLFNLGDGQDTIYEWDDVGTGGIDVLRFGPGIEAADLTFTRSGETLVIAHQNGLDSVTVGWWYYDTTDMGVIERLEFDDGTAHALTGLQIGTIGVDILNGTSGEDVLVGLAGDDILVAGDGNDLLYGGDGDDSLDGGFGDNQLFGGLGNDTYQARLGSSEYYEASSYDFISDSGGSDTMVFGPGINPSDITTTLNVWYPPLSDHLFLSASKVVDGIGYRYDAVITDWGIGNELNPFVGNEIETFIFDSGLQMTAQEIIVQPVSYWFNPDTGDYSYGGRTLSGYYFSTQGGSADGVINGTEAADILKGTGTAMNGYGGNDSLFGEESNDVLNGGAGDDKLSSEAGNDLLDGGLGADTMYGGTGIDTYVVDNVGDTVTENPNEGNDTVQSSITYILGANLENLTLTGTANLIGYGNELDNVLTGNGGNSTLFGRDGNDTLYAGSVTSYLDGGAGADWLEGGDGNDTLYAGTSQGSIDQVHGGAGNDTIVGGDAVGGAWSANFLYGDDGDDLLQGGTKYYNYLVGGAGNDTLIAAPNAGLYNQLVGGAGNDSLTGSAGNDSLIGGLGADTMVGGLGNDSYGVDDLGDVVTENPDEGTDLVTSSITYTLGATLENLTLSGMAVIHGTGNAQNNTLNGSSNSTANVLTGLTGDDTYIVGTGDTVIENANEGTDTVQSSITYTLAANVENLTLTGGTAINGTGNTLDNVLAGNNLNNALYGQAGNDTLAGLAGNDILNGGSGADTMTGGTGNDLYVVDNTGDTVTENVNEGTDTVQSSITYTLGANLENLTLTGTGNINGTGNSLDNVLTGNGGGHLLSGLDGNDTLYGGVGTSYLYGDAGDDILHGGSGYAFLFGGAGNDTIYGGAGGGYLLGGSWAGTNSGDDTLIGGAMDETLIATDGNDTLVGNGGDDYLDGGVGVDAMTGGTGDDTYLVDDLGDTVTENLNEGTDRVNSYITYTLGANVENLTLAGGPLVIDGTGNELNNALAGNGADNVLNGMAGDDTLTGNNGHDTLYGGDGNDTLNGGNGNDTLDGGVGNDSLNGGAGNDTYQFGAGDGQDTLTDYNVTAGNTDTVNAGINPLNLVFSQSGDNLLMSLHGTTDSLSITSWYTGTANQTEIFQATDGSTLANTQVDQLIQAMAQFSANNGGITWDQAIDQQPNDVQAVLAAYWQPAV